MPKQIDRSSAHLNPAVPGVPDNLSAQVVSGMQINITWVSDTLLTGIKGFKIERKTANSQYATLNTVRIISMAPTGLATLQRDVPTNDASSLNGTITYYDRGLSCQTTYYYRVTAYNEKGDSSYSREINAPTY
jgi:hypothetical protein